MLRFEVFPGDINIIRYPTIYIICYHFIVYLGTKNISYEKTKARFSNLPQIVFRNLISYTNRHAQFLKHVKCLCQESKQLPLNLCVL